jgi:hypothetical protein
MKLLMSQNLIESTPKYNSLNDSFTELMILLVSPRLQELYPQFDQDVTIALYQNPLVELIYKIVIRQIQSVQTLEQLPYLLENIIAKESAKLESLIAVGIQYCEDPCFINIKSLLFETLPDITLALVQISIISQIIITPEYIELQNEYIKISQKQSIQNEILHRFWQSQTINSHISNYQESILGIVEANFNRLKVQAMRSLELLKEEVRGSIESD